MDTPDAVEYPLRLYALGIVVGLNACGLLQLAIFRRGLVRYLAEVPTLRGPQEIERYRRVVEVQMYGALSQIALLGIPFLVMVGGTLTGILGGLDSLVCLVSSLVNFAAAMLYKSLEKRVQAVPAATPELEAQRDALTRMWLTRPLPDRTTARGSPT